MAPVSLAHSATSWVSMGLIENISTTRQVFRYFDFKTLAASNALVTIRPHAIIVASEPSRKMFPLPILKIALSSYKTSLNGLASLT